MTNTPRTNPLAIDLSNTTRVAHQMFVVSGTSFGAHITKEVAQATIDTGVVGNTIPAVTLCNKTYTEGSAWESADIGSFRLCKACAKKAGK
jgi:alpha/beta superfamily hydrolase